MQDSFTTAGFWISIWLLGSIGQNAATISVFQQPASAQAGQPLLVQPRVLVTEDSDKQVVITASSSPDDTALYGMNQIFAINGWANFTDLMILKFGVYQIQFISNNGEQATTSTFSTVSGLDRFVMISGNLVPVIAGDPLMPQVLIQPVDRDNVPLLLSRFPVIVSIETIGPDETAASFPAVLSANFTSQSCCMFQDCIQTNSLFASCCDCSNPICALCAMPKDGLISFPGLKINKVGTYQIVFTTDQSSLVNKITNPVTVFRPSTGIATIKPGVPFGINFFVQPVGPLYLGGPKDFGFFEQAPIVKAADKQGNFLSQAPIAGQMLRVAPCFSSADVIPTVPVPDGLCQCDDLACLRVEKNSTFQGQLWAPFQRDSSAVIANLSVRSAFNALRIFAANSINGTWVSTSFSQQFAVSQPFVVLPGSLHSIAALVEPATSSGCPRCPRGYVLANTAFNITVQLLDRYLNRIALCPNNTSPYCRGVPSASVVSRLFAGLEDVSATQDRINLLGTTRQTSSFGVAQFQNLRILLVNRNYAFRFFAFIGTNLSAVSSSNQFQVVAGAPTQLAFVAILPSVLSDSEQFVLAADIVDAQSNVVNSDCYTDCGGQLGGTCSSNVTSCSLQARATLINAGPTSRLVGTLQTSSAQGRVTFSNMTIEANWVNGAECGCPTQTTCLGCSSPKCALPPPWPNFQVSVALPAVPGASITVPVTLVRRIQSLVLLNQPSSLMPAFEPLAVPIQVRALQCDGAIAVLSTASILVQIDSRGANSFAKLAGTFVARLFQGVALFTDLQFDQTGTYNLLFSVLPTTSNSVSVSSQTFVVTKAVSQLLVVSTPGPATAGVPFAIQPKINLLDDSGNMVDLSSISVTATLQDNPGEYQVHDPGMSILMGRVSVQAKYGSVVFTDLSINKASLGQDLSRVGYTIRFSTGNIGVTSSQFTVAPAQWAALFIPPFVQPIGLDAGSPLARQPSVYLVDAFVNRILTSQIPVGTAVQVALVTDQIGTGAVLQRNGCREVCRRVKSNEIYPLQCTTCRDLFSAASSSIVAFTDLRVDISTGSLAGMSRNYWLNFSSSSFLRVSTAFEIQHSAPAYLALDQNVPNVNVADKPLSIQPLISIRDRFGNVVISASNVQGQATLQLPMGSNMTAGQNGLCTLAPNLLEGNLFADFRSGSAQFTNLAVRQAVQGYVLQFSVNISSLTLKTLTSQFSVVAGAAVGLCVMSALGRCADLSPCLDAAFIVCVDGYGNVQPTCAACPSSSCCGRSPFNIPISLQGSCSGAVCSEVLGGPKGSKMEFWSPSEVTNCANSSCFAPLSQRDSGAFFTKIALSPPGSGFLVNFYTYIECMGSLIQWSVTQALNVSAAPPVIINAVFSDSLASVNVQFNKETNMRLSQPSTCDIFDPSFEFKLGVDPLCTWTDPTTILILLGDASSVDNTSRVLLSANCGIRNRAAEPGENQATTQDGVIVGGKILSPIYINLPPVLPLPDPVMVIPRDLGSCSLLRGDSSLSQGYAARPFSTYSWGLDSSLSYASVGILQASAPDSPFLKLSSAYFIKAFIHFSTFVPREVNTVTVTLRPTIPVPSSAHLIISGLSGYSTPMQSCPLQAAENVPVGPCFLSGGTCRTALLRGPSAYRFAPTNFSGANVRGIDPNEPRVQWTSAGAVVLKVDPSHSIPTTEDTVISFQMTNPSSLTARIVSISFSYSGPLICPVADCVMTDSIALTTNTWFKPQAMRTDCNSTDLNSVIAGSVIQSIPCISKLATFYVTTDGAKIIFGNIAESSKVINQENLLNVNVQIGSTPPPGVTLTISGLSGLSYASNNLCLDGPDAGLFECASCVRGLTAGVSFGPAGSWDPVSGRLVLRFVYGRMPAGASNISFAFTLVNTMRSNRRSCNLLDPLACPSLASPVLTLGSTSTPFPLQGDVLGSGYSAAFLSASGQESNSFQNLTNLVLISFAVNFLVTDQCTLSITGLPTKSGTFYSDLTGSNGLSCLQQTDSPRQQPESSQSTLFLINRCRILPGSLFRTWFTIQNSGNAIEGAVLFIAATCPGIDVRIQVQSDPALLRAVSVIRFYDSIISADNYVPYQSNAILVEFRCNAAILAGSILTVSGLTGTNSVDNPLLPVMLRIGSGEFMQQTAAFHRTAGLLVVSLSAGAPAQTSIALQFRLLNGGSPPSLNSALSGTVQTGLCGSSQDCPPFANSSASIIYISKVALNVTSKPLNIKPDVTVAEIRESNRVNGAYNMITFRIRCNFDLLSTTSITIAGLDGSQTLKTSNLIPVSDWTSLFPNCSCPYSEDPYPCLACSESDNILISQSLRIWQPDLDSSGMNRFGRVVYDDNGLPKGSVTGTWNTICPVKLTGASCMILSIAAGQQHPANTDLLFGFLLQNPATETKPVTPQLIISSGSISVSPPVTGAVLGAGLAPGFTALAIKQDSEILGAFATITFQMQTNCPLVSAGFSGAWVTISGLSMFQTPNGYLPLRGEGARLASRDGWGSWQQEAAVLVLNGAMLFGDCSTSLDHKYVPMCSQQVVEFSVILKSKKLAVIGQALPGVSAGSTTTQITYIPFGGSALNRATVTPAFTLASVRQSSKVQGQPNNISFTFSCNTHLTSYGAKDKASASRVTISGLLGTQTPDSYGLPLSGANATLFDASSTVWTQADGTLTVRLVDSITVAPNDPIQFSIVLINPLAPQQEVGVSIVASVYPFPDDTSPPISSPITVQYGAPLVLEPSAMLGLGILSAYLRPSVLSSSISESSLVGGAINTFSLNFTLNVDLQPGGTLELKGLRATTSSTALILIGGQDSDSVSSATWDKTPGILSMSLAMPIYADAPFAISFKLQNRLCPKGPPPAQPVSMLIVGPRIQGGPEVSIGWVVLKGQLVGCGAQLLWRRREVLESAGSTYALNTLSFTIQPSAPLYAGTVVTVTGLTGTQTDTCVSCLAKSKLITWTLGMSCSLLCDADACASQGGFVAGVFGAQCITIFSGSPPNPSEVFGSMGLWQRKTGTLMVTVADGQVLTDTEPTTVSITVWNPVEVQSRVDCVGGATGSCLAVTAYAEMCDKDPTKTRLDSEACRNGVRTLPSSITAASPPLTALYDPCPICLRSADIMAVHFALQGVAAPAFTGLTANTPALTYTPALVDGGYVKGTYVLLLTLTNWLGMSGTSRATFTSDGPLSLNDAKPLVYIRGNPELDIKADDPIMLSASGAAATCLEGFETETVSYQWTMACAGSLDNANSRDVCALAPDLDAVVATRYSATLYIPPRSLPAGAAFVVTCAVRQFNLVTPTQSYVHVRVQVSPIVAIISGASAQIAPTADFYLSATDSYDPDAATTGLKSHITTVSGRQRTNFAYSWACEQLVCDAGAAACPTRVVPCPPRLLGLSRQTVIPVVSSFRTDDYEAGVNRTLLVPGATYRVTLNVSRKVDMLPLGLQSIRSFRAVSSTKFDFFVAPSSPVSVSIELCGTVCNGRGAQSKVVGTASRVVLNATVAPSSARAQIDTVAWTVVQPPNDNSLLTPAAVLTSVNSRLLVLRAGSLVPGHTVTFRCTALDTDDVVGYAEISVVAAVPPLGGGLTATPPAGSALETSFQLRALGWTVDSDKLPLTYTFLLAATGESTPDLTLASSSSLQINTILPAGPGGQSVVGLRVAVADALGSVSTRRLGVRVAPRRLSLAELGAVVDTRTADFFRSGDMLAVQSVLSFAAVSLDQTDGAARSLVARQLFRIKLLTLLETSRQSQLPSVGGVLSRVATLSALTQAPEELNFEAVELAVAAVKAAGSEILAIPGNPPDGPSSAAAFARVYDNLMRAMASIAPPTGVSPRSVDGGARPARGRVAAPVAADYRTQMGQLLQGIAALSSLSVRDALVGELPRVVASGMWEMATSRVATAGFRGFTARLGNVTVTFPLDMFLQIDKAQLPDRPETAEIMLVQFRTSPIPLHDNPLGLPVMFEVRAFGSADPLPILAVITTPIVLKLPWEGTLTGGIDRLGRSKVPYIGRFVPAASVWDWSSTGVSLVSSGSASVTVGVGVFGTFSIFGANAGCDLVPASPAVWDSCRVCKGDNSSCSGCDGIPNTGRFKNCSGHGRCVAGEPRCRCVEGWYGEVCNTSCSLETVCGGHGFCDPDNGLECYCLSGWASTSPPPVYPGPFCTVNVVPPPNTTAADAAKARTLDLILYVAVPAIAGSVALVAAAVYVLTASQRRRRKLRSKILDLALPPPQPAPDETGWGSDMPPGGTAGGPEGGAAGGAEGGHTLEARRKDAHASAMAASVRTAVDRRGADALRQRADAMRQRIAAGVTATRYARGPMALPPVMPELSDGDGEHAQGGFASSAAVWGGGWGGGGDQDAEEIAV
jgi:hypothetical protein